MTDVTLKDIELLNEAAGYLDGSIHHFGTLKREALSRDLRKLAERLAPPRQNQPSESTPFVRKP